MKKILLTFLLIALSAEGGELSVVYPFPVQKIDSWFVQLRNNNAVEQTIFLDQQRGNFELYTESDKLLDIKGECVVRMGESLLGFGFYWLVNFEKNPKIQVKLPDKKCLIKVNIPQEIAKHSAYNSEHDYVQLILKFDEQKAVDPFFLAYAPVSLNSDQCVLPLPFAVTGRYLHRICSMSGGIVLYESPFQITDADLESNVDMHERTEFDQFLEVSGKEVYGEVRPLVRIKVEK